MTPSRSTSRAHQSLDHLVGVAGIVIGRDDGPRHDRKAFAKASS
jgi:hypothetical protein